jgi:hypothetical protein
LLDPFGSWEGVLSSWFVFLCLLSFNEFYIQAFEIYYKDSTRAFTTATDIVVDGNPCTGRFVLSRQEGPLSKSDTVVNRGVIVSNDSYRPFVFSSCQLTGGYNYNRTTHRMNP